MTSGPFVVQRKQTECRYNMTVATRFNTSTDTYDAGLRAYMISVYNNMCLALGISGLVSVTLAQNAAAMAFIWQTWFAWVVILAPLAMMFGLMYFADRVGKVGIHVFLWLFAAAMGVMMSSIFLKFALGSIASTFFITSAVFASASLYGYVTKSDLSSLGVILGMAVWGLIIAMVVNIFLASSFFATIISCVAVVVFVGLTATDTQEIKDGYDPDGDNTHMSVLGALLLYLNFVNIFLHLLQLIGEAKE